MKLFRLIVSCIVIVFGVASATAQDDRTTITVWHIFTDEHPLQATINQAIEDYNASQDEFFIEATAIQQEQFKSDIQLAIDNDEQPDAFFTWGGGTLFDFVEQGSVRAIPELSADDSPFLQSALTPSTRDGEVFAIPVSVMSVNLVVNRALFEAHDLELPTTWEQFMTACDVLSQVEGVTPVYLANQERWLGTHWFVNLAIRQGGTDTFNEALSAGTGFADDVFVEAGASLQTVVENCFNSDYMDASFTNFDDTTALANGEAGMLLGGTWILSSLRRINPDSYENDLMLARFPAIGDDEGVNSQILGGTGEAFAISWKAPEGTAAVLVDLFTSESFVGSQIEAGSIPALVGVDTRIEDPLVAENVRLIQDSSFMQIPYDQALPRELALAHLDTTTGLLDLSMSPEQAAELMEQVAQMILGN